MAALWGIAAQTLVIICTLLSLEYVEGRGARGGRFGGSRSSRTSRSSGSVRSTRSSTWWKGALVVGTIYGARRYMGRRRYLDDPDSEPQICTNTNLVENGTTYGMFICPMWNQDDSMAYCCGEENNETCCGFWDDGGRIAGVVIGILIFVAIIATCIFCFCCRQTKRRPTMFSTNKRNQPPVHYQSGPPASNYPVSPPAVPVSPYEGAPSPYTRFSFPTAPAPAPYNPTPFGSDKTAPYPVAPPVGQPAPYPGGAMPPYPTMAPAMPQPPPSYGQDPSYPPPTYDQAAR